MKRRVLIVDDEVTILSGARKLLQDHGVAVDIAETMEEALALLKMRDYESVIVGLKYADSSGDGECEILTHIKENKATTGIILLTGCGSPYITEDTLAIAAQYYYEKRVLTRILREALKKCGRGSPV